MLPAFHLRMVDFLIPVRLDFMLQGDLDCVPIEVKAEQNLRVRSLRAFCDKYKPGMAICSSMSNYKQEYWLTNVPLVLIQEPIRQRSCREDMG